MTIREAVGILLFAMLMQLSTVVIVALLRPEAEIGWATVVITVLVMSAVAGSVASGLVVAFRRYEAARAAKVAMMTLTEDERRVLERIMQQGRVRQDNLRHQVHMSKSKLSALVNDLVQKRTITKKRYHKTNILEPTEEFKR